MSFAKNVRKLVFDRIKMFIPKTSSSLSFSQSVFLMVGGTTIAQILNIATMPLFSRIYSPEDFGVLALFASIAGILVEFSGLCYHMAIPLPKKKVYAESLVILSVLIQCAFITILTLALLLANDFLLGLVSAELLKPYWFLLPFGIGAMGLYLILTQWAVRESEFSIIARTRLTQSIWGIATKLVLGLIGLKPFGLLLGTIASQVGGIVTLGLRLIKKNGLPKTDKAVLKHVAIKYRKFPLFTIWASLLNTLGRQVPAILLVAFYGTQTAGLFTFGMQILQLPATFIGKAIGQVFVQKVSVAKYEGNLAEISLKTFEVLLQLGTFPILCLCLLAPDLFSFVFGAKWYMAGVFSRYLGIWIIFMFIFSPLSSLYLILGKQKEDLFFQIFNVIGRISAILLGCYWGNASLSIIFYGIFSMSFAVFALIWIFKQAGIAISVLIIHICRVFLESFILLAPGIILYFVTPNILYPLAMVFLTSIFYFKKLILIYKEFQ